MSYLVEETSRVRRPQRYRAATLREALLLAKRKAPLVLTDWVHVRQERQPLVSLRFVHEPRTTEPDGVAAGEYEYEWYDDAAQELHALLTDIRVSQLGPRSRPSILAERGMTLPTGATV